MASDVSPKSERAVPPRTASVAGRHLSVIERSWPVKRFMRVGIAGLAEGRNAAARNAQALRAQGRRRGWLAQDQPAGRRAHLCAEPV